MSLCETSSLETGVVLGFLSDCQLQLGAVDGFGIGLCAQYEPSEIPSGIMFLWVT